MTTTRFKDRYDAGRCLAVALAQSRDSDPIVLGLLRGGMPVANEVVEDPHASFDVLVVRKLDEVTATGAAVIQHPAPTGLVRCQQRAAAPNPEVDRAATRQLMSPFAESGR